SANFDSHQWSTAITYEKTNVQDSYRNKSSLQCTINSSKRKQKQNTKQSPITTKPKKKARFNKESISNESSLTYEQEQQLDIDYKKLTVQKSLNDELEREIRLRQQLKSLCNTEPNDK
ncbi:8840_t:CDS:2, partial [Dentiscutata erythropus]